MDLTTVLRDPDTVTFKVTELLLKTVTLEVGLQIELPFIKRTVLFLGLCIFEAILFSYNTHLYNITVIIQIINGILFCSMF